MIGHDFVRFSKTSREVLCRRHASEFQCADQDHTGCLRYEEFAHLLVPKATLVEFGETSVKRWFDTMLSPGSSSISVAEYFLWSLGAANEVTGGRAVEGFRKFDKSKSGALDEAEFQQVAVELGYGEYGRDIFLANSDIDYAGVQTLNYNALLRKCCREVSSFFAKEFVQAMQWSEVDPYAMSLDNASFSFTAESPEAARLALLDLLERHDVTLHKAFQAIDVTNDLKLTRDEFCSAMYEVLGYSGKRSVLEQIFAAIDWDKSGSVTFEEFHAWTINRKTRLERHSGDTKKLSLTEVRPTTPTVRRRSWVAGVVVGPSSLPVACRSLS